MLSQLLEARKLLNKSSTAESISVDFPTALKSQLSKCCTEVIIYVEANVYDS